MSKSRIFTLTAVLSLALSIGVNTAGFSLMHAIMLKPLPVRDPDALVVVSSYSDRDRIGDFGYPDYLALRADNQVFSGVLAASTLGAVDAISGSGADREEAVTIQRKIVSNNYFSILGVPLALGRGFESGGQNEDGGGDDLPLTVSVIAGGKARLAETAW